MIAPSVAGDLALSRLGNERHVNHDRPSPCAGLQSYLTKCRLLHTTLTPIAVECGRASRAFSMAIAAADYRK
jgi:hypothetical protein